MQWLLVAGGAGIIGSRRARALLNAGYEIDVADDLSTGAVENVPEGARLTRVDLSEPGALAALDDRSYAAVLHLAGQSSSEKSCDRYKLKGMFSEYCYQEDY